MIIIIFLIICWLIIGARGFIYWWTNEFDFTTSEILMCCGASLLGPLSWIVGYFIHGQSQKEKMILISRRIANKNPNPNRR